METSAGTLDRRIGPIPRSATRETTVVAAALGAVVALGVALRFATLGLQSYHHDEVITAARVLPGSIGHVLHEVRVSESCPPLYYLLAHWWGGVFGFREAGLRSLSALFGALTIPAAYLVGVELWDRRAGLITAALVALGPMFIWYSQETRAYALLVLLTAVSLLFFLRALRTCSGTDIVLWGLASGLALCTHYFAAGVVAIEAGWLLVAFGLDLVVLAAIGVVAMTALALAPLAMTQANPNHIGWISSVPLPPRLLQTAASFTVGETGRLIAQRPHDGLALPFATLAAAGVLLGTATRKGLFAVGMPLAIGLGSVVLAVIAALAGHDYVIARNLLPALLPLCAAIGAGLAASSRRWLAATIAIALCAGLLALDVDVTRSPALQRPDWRGLAADLGPPAESRAIVSWRLGAIPLKYYLDGGGDWIHSGATRVREIDIAGRPGVERRPIAIPGFHAAGEAVSGRLAVVRYLSRRPRPVRFDALDSLPTGFGKNAVILQDAVRMPRTTIASGSGL